MCGEYKMRLGLILIALAGVVAKPFYDCLTWDTIQCLTCGPSYEMTPFCSLLCPTYYTVSSNACSYSGNPPMLFDLDFSSITDLTSTGYGVFSNQLNSTGSAYRFNDTSQKTPLPTVDRGLYLVSTSLMKSNTALIPSPNFTVKMWVKTMTPGVIFNVYDTDYLYGIQATSIGVKSYFRLCTAATISCLNFLSSDDIALSQNWHHIVFTFEFTFNSCNIGITIDYGAILIKSFSGYENSLGRSSGEINWYIGGSSGSFGGFLYRLSAFNGIETSNLPFVDPPNCINNQYWDGECHNCMSGCSTWPWCVRENDCSYCFSSLYTTCYGYARNQYTGTFTGCSMTNCVECSVSSFCTWADYPYLIQTYKYFDSSNIYQYTTNNLYAWMGSNEVSNNLQSGANGATDYFNSPDPDDYVPVPCRGFYFTGGTFGQTRTAQLFTPQFNFYIWIKGTSGTAVSKTSGLAILYDGSLVIPLTNRDLSKTTFTIPGSLSTLWTYVEYGVTYMNFDTTIIQCIDLVCSASTTYQNYLYRDTKSAIVVGKSAASTYTGFIFEITVTNKYYSFNSGWLDGDTPNDCNLSECALNQSPGDYCQNCDPSCAFCITTTLCGACLDPNCDMCYDLNYCDICKAGFTLSRGECLTSRGVCTHDLIGLDCDSCNSGYFSLDRLCLIACPTGYTATSSFTCVLQTTQIINLNLLNAIKLDTYQGFNIGINNTNIYPDFDQNDPIPSQNRGYYFTSTSSMNITGITFNYKFSMNFWTKMLTNGFMIRKCDFICTVYITSYTTYSEIDAEFYNQQGYVYTYYYPYSFSSWNYVEFIVSLDIVNLRTNLNSYLNTNLINTRTSYYNWFFEDFATSELVIGDSPGLNGGWSWVGFTGYFYSFQVYNTDTYIGIDYDSLNCVGCATCPLDLTCLGNCPMDQLEPLCDPCPSCSHGCRAIENCNLCSDPFCGHCTTFLPGCNDCTNGAILTASGCACEPGYKIIGISCILCHSSCSDCNGPLVTECYGCAVGYLWFTDLVRCLPGSVCPNNYGNGVNCTFSGEPLVFDAVFDGILDIVYDTVGNLPLQSGSSSSFYPSYSSDDVRAAKGRGYYFTSTSFMTIDGAATSRLVLAPEFTISLWALVNADGTIFSRKVLTTQYLKISTSVGISAEFTLLSGPISFNWGGTFSYNQWNLIQLCISLNDTLETFSLYVNDVYTYTTNPNYYSDPIISTTTLLGDPVSSFNGFIWSLQVRNQFILSSFNSDVNCIYPISLSSCLPTCLITEYFDGTCIPCLNTCVDTCGFVNSCTLCDDMLCEICENYSTCNTCKMNAGVDIATGLCKCNFGAVELVDVCETCHPSCMECTGFTYSDCISCQTGYLEFSDYGRCLPADKCPNSYGAGPICVFNTTNRIFAIWLTTLEDIVYDLDGGIPIQSGNDSAYYPKYGLHDVRGSYDRGVYFTPTSYLHIGNTTTSPFLLGPEFTISFWVLSQANGILMIKNTSTVDYLTITLSSNVIASLNTISGIQSVTSTSLTTNVWHLLEFSKSLLDDGEQLRISIDRVSSLFAYASYYKDPLNNTSIWLGHSVTSFKGFVWKLTINNQQTLGLFNTGTNCIYPVALTTCLPVCLITFYYSNTTNSCIGCNSGCAYCRNNTSCSMCPDPLCSSCPLYSDCFQCKNNATLASTCTCDHLFTYNSTKEECDPVTCYEGCYTCNSSSVFHCSECNSGLMMLNSVCVRVPTGYINNTGVLEINSEIAFAIGLEAILGVIYDNQNKIPVVTGNSDAFYPFPDSEDPIPTRYQGYYFDGVSSVMRLPIYKKYTFPELVLAPTWGLDLTILPNSNTGTILFSNSTNCTLFNIYFSNSNVVVNLTLADNIYSSTISNSTLVINEWNFIYVSVTYTTFTSISIYINDVISAIMSTPGIFVNVFNSTSITIGGQPGISYYTGFLYSISIDTSGVFQTSRELSTCLITVNGGCLPTCTIKTYWVGPNASDCLPCDPECKNCVKAGSCNLCSDFLCELCKDYSTKGCTKCTANASGTSSCACQSPSNLDLISNLCVICNSNQVFNGTTCQDCPTYCASCSTSACLTCIDNAELNDGKCSCKLGFYGDSICTATYLSCSMSLTSLNAINLLFTDELRTTLLASDFSISSCISLTYTMEQWSETRYFISINILVEVPANCTVTLTFKDTQKVISVKNAPLSTSSLSDSFIQSLTAEAAAAVTTAAAAEASASATTASTAATTSVSMMNPNPACLWSFINTIQMLCFIDLSNIPLPPKFAGYLKGLKKYNMFPNFFKYFLEETGGDTPYKKAYDYGYKTNLLLFNSGNYISAFITMLVLFFLTFCLSKATTVKPFSILFLKKKIENSLKNYKYGAFIRFWITCYLEVFAAALIAVLTTSHFTIQSCINLGVAIVLIVIFT